MADSAIPGPPARRRATALLAAAVRRGTELPAWVAVIVVAGLLVAVWVATLVAGGTRTAMPHLFYVPILAAALSFGTRGALVTAVAAMGLAGPLMPLDTAAMESQALANWMLRGVFFLVVALVAGLSLALRDRYYEQQFADQFRVEMDRGLTEATRIGISAAEVRDALENGRFRPVFQPVYSLRDGRLRAVEALTRFDAEPYRSPDQWFTAAQEHGLSVELELAAVAAAFRESSSLPVHIALSINASPATLLDPRFLALVREQTSRILVAEVTEHAVVTDYRLLQSALADLRAHGVRVAVDDAGSGVSSLLHIVQLVPDIIKVDLTLAQGVGASPVRRAMATCLIDFAHRTGAELVVEGIEQECDLQAWSDLGAHAVQGFLVGRPGPLPFPPMSDHIPDMRAPSTIPQQRAGHATPGRPAR